LNLKISLILSSPKPNPNPARRLFGVSVNLPIDASVDFHGIEKTKNVIP
jgi:hypothetical protein